MDSMEEKIDSILSNPDMMEKIMTMAQSLGGSRQDPPTEGLPEMDPKMLQRLSGLAKQGNIDAQQKDLLHALGPYLSRQRIQKLEKAMRAAKMASFAAAALGTSGLNLFTGR